MKVVVRDSHHGTFEYDLDASGKDNAVFGRQQDCDIVLRSSFVSRPHGIIFRENGQWYIQDVQSTYGTYYKERKIQKMPITDGTVIHLYSNDKSQEHCVELKFYEPYQAKPQPVTTVTGSESFTSTSIIPRTGGKSPFPLIAMISGILALITILFSSKTGAWLPLIFALTAVTFAVIAFVGRKNGKGMSLAGVCTGGVALILVITLIIMTGRLGRFSWCVNARHFPLSTALAKMFDSPEDIDREMDALSAEELDAIPEEEYETILKVYFGTDDMDEIRKLMDEE